MNIDKFKQQHVDILACIAELRQFAKIDIGANAAKISAGIVAMSALIKLHLAVEDKVLYPALRNGKDATLAALGTQFQKDMDAIAQSYMGFVSRWTLPDQVRANPQAFRADANQVLRTLHERIQQENTVFYPKIEAL